MPAPTVWSNEPFDPPFSHAWNNPSNGSATGASYASTAPGENLGLGSVTDALRGLNPNFGAPENMTIRRVILSYNRKAIRTPDCVNIRTTARLVVDGTPGDLKQDDTDWSDSDETATMTWDVPEDLSLSVAQANAAGFGVDILAGGVSGGINNQADASVNNVSLSLVVDMRHIKDSHYFGRKKLGQKLSLVIVTKDNTDVPTQPDAAPEADIYFGETLVETVKMPILERYKTSWTFGVPVFLGGKYSLGNHMIVFRYAFSTVKYQQFGYFEIRGGGSATGPVIAMAEYNKPAGQFLLTHGEDGNLRYYRNPEIS